MKHRGNAGDPLKNADLFSVTEGKKFRNSRCTAHFCIHLHHRIIRRQGHTAEGRHVKRGPGLIGITHIPEFQQHHGPVWITQACAMILSGNVLTSSTPTPDGYPICFQAVLRCGYEGRQRAFEREALDSGLHGPVLIRYKHR